MDIQVTFKHTGGIFYRGTITEGEHTLSREGNHRPLVVIAGNRLKLWSNAPLDTGTINGTPINVEHARGTLYQGTLTQEQKNSILGNTKRKPTAEQTLKVDPDGTPMENANALYSRSRRKTPRDPDHYNFLRYRQYTHLWRTEDKQRLIDAAEDHLEEIQSFIEAWTPLGNWMQNAVITEEQYLQQEGITDINEKKRFEGGFFIHRHILASKRSSMQSFTSKIENRLSRMERMIEDYETSEDILETLKDSLVAEIITSLGVEVNDAFNQRDDGCLWFKKDGRDYFFALSNLVGDRSRSDYDILGTPIVFERNFEQWADFPWVSLSYFSGIDSNVVSQRPLTKIFEDYFGAWNLVRSRYKWYHENIENAPAVLDVEQYLNRDVQPRQ